MLHVLCYTDNVPGSPDFRDFRIFDSQIQLGKAKAELGEFRHARQYTVQDESEIPSAIALDRIISLSYRISLGKLAKNPEVLDDLVEIINFLEEN